MRLIPILVLGGLMISGCTTVSRAPTPIHVIGHRGAAAYAPENTMPSFDKAFALGLTEIELDVQLSKDGKVVLFHDDTMEKKTALKGRIRDHDWSVLKTAEIGTWFDRERGAMADRKFAGTNLNLLSELFDRYEKRFFYHVEIKTEDDRLPAALLALLKERGLKGHYLVTSFYKEQLVRLHALDASIPLCYLIDDEKREKDLAAAIRESKSLGFRQVALRAPVIEASHVALARDNGLKIRGWGVKSKTDMERVLSAGAEGMTIDWPDWLVRKVLESTPAAL